MQYFLKKKNQPGVLALFFCNYMEFWHIFGSFQRESVTVGRMDIN